MRISDLPVVKLSDAADYVQAAVVVIRLSKQNSLCTWRAVGQTLPQGQMLGVAFVTFARTESDGNDAKPFSIAVDRGLYEDWKQIKWEPHFLRYDKRRRTLKFANAGAKQE